MNFLDRLESKTKVNKWIILAFVITILITICFLIWFYCFNKIKTPSNNNIIPVKTTSDNSGTKDKNTIAQDNGSFDYSTDKGNLLNITAITVKNNQWSEVTLEESNKVGFIQKAIAAGKKFVIDFSKNFDLKDSFQVISKANDKFLLAGGTNAKKTLYTTDWKSLEDFSNKLPNLQNSAITSADFDGQKWLLGLSTVGGDQNSKLLSFDGQNIVDLSDQSMTASANCRFDKVNSIKWNGNQWLILASGASCSKIMTYDNNSFSDLTSKLPNNTFSINSADWNGSYWLLGGKQYRSITFRGNNEYKQSIPALVKLDNNEITDLSSNIEMKSPGSSGVVDAGSAEIITINYNQSSKKFYIGGTDIDGSKTPLFYSYNGQEFQNLRENLSGMQWINAMNSNDKGDQLIGGSNQNDWQIYRLSNNIYEKLPLETKNFANYVTSIAHDGNSFFIGGWGGIIIKVIFQK